MMGLLSRTGHDDDMVQEIANINQLENVDGDKVYALINQKIPDNRKPPGREWTNLDKVEFKTTNTK